MDDPRERDQFARITLYQDIGKARQMLARYEEGMSHYRHVIEAVNVRPQEMLDRLLSGHA